MVDRKLNDAEKTVQLSVEVDPGPQYRMGQLTIEGLDIETEPHNRKMWALKPNQPFNVEYPDTFLAEMPNVLDKLAASLGVALASLFAEDERAEATPLVRRA